MDYCARHKNKVTHLCKEPDCAESSAAICALPECRSLHTHGGKVGYIEAKELLSQVRNCFYFNKLIEGTKETVRQYYQQALTQLRVAVEKEEAIALAQLQGLKYRNRLSAEQVGQVEQLSQGILSKVSARAVHGLLQCLEEEMKEATAQKHFEQIQGYFANELSEISKRVEALKSTAQFKTLNLLQAFRTFNFPVASELPSALVHDEGRGRLLSLLSRRGVNCKDMELVFRASEHNFSSLLFHKYCDGVAPVLVLAKSEHQEVFGGYSNAPFDSAGGHIADLSGNTFLFSLTKNLVFDIYSHKLAHSLAGNRKFGPQFGEGCDLFISDDCDKNRKSGSKLGRAFRLPEGYRVGSVESDSLLGGEPSFMVVQYEVFRMGAVL